MAPGEAETFGHRINAKAYDSLDAMIDKARYDPATASTRARLNDVSPRMSAIRSPISASHWNFCRPSVVEPLRQRLLTTSWAVQLTQVRKPREALGAWGMSLLKAEGAAADEDEDTQANQNDREQHMLPAFENLRDRWTGGHELRQQD